MRYIRGIFGGVLLLSMIAVCFGQSASVHSGQKVRPDTNLALYMFLHAVAVEDSAPANDIIRREAMIKMIGFNDQDRAKFEDIVKEYAALNRTLHEHELNSISPDDGAVQRENLKNYVHVIRRLRTELSPQGIQVLHSHLETKKQKMEIHARGEKQ